MPSYKPPKKTLEEKRLEALTEDIRGDVLHALRMDHGHTTANEMQRCGTCSRRATRVREIVSRALLDAHADGIISVDPSKSPPK